MIYMYYKYVWPTIINGQTIVNAYFKGVEPEVLIIKLRRLYLGYLITFLLNYEFVFKVAHGHS